MYAFAVVPGIAACSAPGETPLRRSEAQISNVERSERFEVRDEIVDLRCRQVRSDAVFVAAAARAAAIETSTQGWCASVVHEGCTIRDVHERRNLELFARADIGKLVVREFFAVVTRSRKWDCYDRLVSRSSW
jgi:hypothetical protein